MANEHINKKMIKYTLSFLLYFVISLFFIFRDSVIFLDYKYLFVVGMLLVYCIACLYFIYTMSSDFYRFINMYLLIITSLTILFMFSFFLSNTAEVHNCFNRVFISSKNVCNKHTYDFFINMAHFFNYSYLSISIISSISLLLLLTNKFKGVNATIKFNPIKMFFLGLFINPYFISFILVRLS